MEWCLPTVSSGNGFSYDRRCACGNWVLTRLKNWLLSKQVMCIKQPISNLRPFFHTFTDCGRNRQPSLATQAWQFVDHNLNPTHAFDFSVAGCDMYADTQLQVHQALHVFQVFQALKVFQALQQLLLFLAGQSQDALVCRGGAKQLFALAVT